MAKIVLIFESRLIDGGKQPNEQVFIEAHDENGNSIDVGEWAADGEYETLTIDCERFATKNQTIIRLTQPGLHRVLNGYIGMTFMVDKFTQGKSGMIAHVRDYRYPDEKLRREYQIWSIGPNGYHII